MHVSFPEDVTERLTSKASEMNLSPEEVVKFVVETIFGPSPLEIDQEIAQDRDLGAALDRARSDVRAGRVFSHAEVLEWHRHHPE
jgi:predicted transcriptional regulator